MSDRVVSLLRTGVPVAWGWLLTQLAAILPGPVADALGTPEVKSAVTAGAVVAWYGVWRWLEPRIPAWLTRLVLGSAKPPAYAPLSADGVPVITTLPMLPLGTRVSAGYTHQLGTVVANDTTSGGSILYVVEVDGLTSPDGTPHRQTYARADLEVHDAGPAT